ncbi:MAG: DEAD/DEAH box helicase [Euryarchaeota archaeon]|nr:DEAD/DEAH box helicase [Euryarchaeota archaeon]|tara:strand:- start:1409 stop:2692 length:1284 start_codon:yes stop_codon:yes gene_type:complete
MTFEELKITRQFLNAIDDCGYAHPSPIQEKAIPRISAGQDVIGIAQTGTGKTAAFALPVLQKIKYAQDLPPRALVLVPTKELVIQVYEVFTTLGKYTDLRSIALYGGVGPKTQLEELEKGVDIIIATPGRFMDLYLRGGIETKKIKTLVLDECDRMMDMGFMPQLRNILEVIPSKRQNLLFSATFPERVEKLSEEFLLWPTKIEVSPQATPVATVKQRKSAVPNIRTKLHYVAHLLENEYADERALVFVRTKEQAEQISKYLERTISGGVRGLHSNKGQNTRLHSMSLFREGTIRVLVSTDVASRGIDVPETKLVINCTVPRNSSDYVHRIGRTGRAFSEGIAHTLYDPSEKMYMEAVESHLPGNNVIEECILPDSIPVEETPTWEAKQMAKDIDYQKRKADPNYKGAFHEKKKKKSSSKSRTRRRK